MLNVAMQFDGFDCLVKRPFFRIGFSRDRPDATGSLKPLESMQNSRILMIRERRKRCHNWPRHMTSLASRYSAAMGSLIAVYRMTPWDMYIVIRARVSICDFVHELRCPVGCNAAQTSILTADMISTMKSTMRRSCACTIVGNYFSAGLAVAIKPFIKYILSNIA